MLLSSAPGRYNPEQQPKIRSPHGSEHASLTPGMTIFDLLEWIMAQALVTTHMRLQGKASTT